MPYVERDIRGRYAIHDIDVEELHALERALRCANLPDSRILHALKRRIESMT